MPTAEALLPYLREIDARRWYTNYGPLNTRLEQRLVAEIAPGTDQLVTTVANCTVGIELALQALALRPGTGVLVPSITFVATATAITRVGLQPVFADVDPDTWLLTPDIARRSRSEINVGAVLAVSTFGATQDMVAWDALSAELRLPVVIDAAGAFGNQPPGGRCDVVYSLHATKTLGAGEGGFVASRSADRISRIRRLANFGIDTSIGELAEVGTNGKLSEYHAAVALASLDAWQQTSRERIELMARYVEQLRMRCPEVALQEKNVGGVYPLLAVLLPSTHSATVVGRGMAAQGVETRRWYCPPLHRHDPLRDAPKTELTVSESLGDRILGLPFFLGMANEQIDRVLHVLRNQLDLTGTAQC